MPYSDLDRQALIGRLCMLADPAYKDFHAALVPGLDPASLLGVRMPALRKEAKKLMQGDFRAFLSIAQDVYKRQRWDCSAW